MKKYISLILLILFTMTYTYGQQDQLIYKYRQMAVEYQQQIKMAQSNLAGAESMVEAAKSDFLPKLDLYGDYSYLGVPIQLAPNSDGDPGVELHNRYSLDLGLFQPILTGGYLKNTKNAALSQAEIMRSYVNLSEQEIMAESDNFYWNAVTKKEMNDILVQYRDAIGEFLKVIQDRVDEEVVGMNELYQTKVRYNDAEYKVIRSNKEFKISVMILNRLVGLPVNTTTYVADSLLAINWIKTDVNHADKALQQRPEIDMVKNKISLNEFNEKITASQYNPQFGVGVGGNWGAPSPGLSTDPAFNYNLQARLAIPVFYWGKKKEEVFASRQQTEVAKLEMEQTRDMITLEVETSYYNLQQSQQQLDFAASSLENAQSNVEVMLDRYFEGLSSVLEVLDAQLDWQKTYSNFTLAKHELNIAYTSYQRAMGELSITQ
jgi:outer membrane protein TolC